MKSINTKKQFNCIICQNKTHKIFDYHEFAYYRCPFCRHVTTLPYPAKSQIEMHYIKGFEKGNYSVVRKHNHVYRSVMKDYIRIIKRYFDKQQRPLNELSILDIGCFTGDFLCGMKEQGANVHGIELQDEAVRIANKRLPGRIVQGDILSDEITLAQDRFDVISLLGLIEHVVDPIHVLEYATQRLDKNGLLIIETPNSSSFLARVMSKLWPPYTPIEHIHLFSKKSLRLLLNRLGFKKTNFKPHWKTLSVSYVYSMFETFGPEFYKLLRPFYKTMPKFILRRRLPFYGGEMIVLSSYKKVTR